MHQIVPGLTDGVILIDPDQTIARANATALVLHGAADISELGRTVTEYRKRFQQTYRNSHELPDGDYPMERLLSGEAFSGVVVEVRRPGTDRHWVHEIRALVLTDTGGRPDCLVLIINDETERFNAERGLTRPPKSRPGAVTGPIPTVHVTGDSRGRFSAATRPDERARRLLPACDVSPTQVTVDS